MFNQKTIGEDGAREALLQYLVAHPSIGKAQLLRGVATQCGLEEARLSETLTALLREKKICRKGLRYTVAKELDTVAAPVGKHQKNLPTVEAADPKKVENAVTAYLKHHSKVSRKELLDGALEQFSLTPAEKRDESPRSRKNLLRNEICRAMRSLTESGVLKKEQMLYSLNAEDQPASPIGKSNEKTQKKKNVLPARPAKTASNQKRQAPAPSQNTPSSTAPMTKRQEGEAALQAVKAYLTRHPASTRQAILAGAIELCGLSPTEMKDPSPDSPAVRLRSRIGQVLTNLINNGEAVKQGNMISLKKAPRGTPTNAEKPKAPTAKKEKTNQKDNRASLQKTQKQATKKATEEPHLTEAQRAAEAVIKYLSAHPNATRKAILDGAIATYGLTPAEMNQRSPNSRYVRTGSYVGSALTSLIQQGSILKNGGEHRLANDSHILVKETECEEAVRRLLKKKKYPRRELFRLLEETFGTNATASPQDDRDLQKLTERVVEKLIASGEIVNGDGGVLCAVKPITSEKVMPEQECKRLLLEQLVARDGRFFERFLANALEKYFLTSGRNVTYCNIPGGSADGGIDVEVHTVDELGFSEQILVQAKCRGSQHVTEKEVREFYGALHAQKGSRGIYVTTSVFHPSAQKLLDSLDNCVGIDGDRLFDLLKKAEYGVKPVKNGYSIDPAVF